MGTGALRYLSQPRPVRVIRGPDGTPHALIPPGGRRRAVVELRDEWLVQDRWWTDQPVERHFYELLVEPGRITTVFCELRSGEWFDYG